MPHAPWSHNTVFRMSLLGTCQGQAIVNVFHYEATDTFEGTLTTDALAQAAGVTLATDWATNIVASWKPLLPTDYSLNAIRMQVVERPGQKDHMLLATDYVTGMPTPGTGTSVADDLSTAAVIKWRSVVAGRHSRGRTYVGPLYETQTAGGVLILPAPFTTFATSQVNRYSGSGAGVTAGFRFSVYSRPYDAPHGAYTVRVPGSGLTVVNNTTDYDGDINPITTGAVDLTLRTQRRRQLAVGS